MVGHNYKTVRHFVRTKRHCDGTVKIVGNSDGAVEQQ